MAITPVRASKVVIALVATCALLVVACLGLAVWATGLSRHGAATERWLAGAEVERDAFRELGTSLTGCTERGGAVSRRPFGSSFCKIDYPDAGRACTDMTECLGGCTLPNAVSAAPGQGGLKGTCKPSNVLGGCTTYLIRGHAAATECID
jgi:hypothetical protein